MPWKLKWKQAGPEEERSQREQILETANNKAKMMLDLTRNLLESRSVEAEVVLGEQIQPAADEDRTQDRDREHRRRNLENRALLTTLSRVPRSLRNFQRLLVKLRRRLGLGIHPLKCQYRK